MARRLRYQVAVSLDGFIAGPRGDYDWIIMDPAIDFAALFSDFDAAVMGRKTYEVVTRDGHMEMMSGMQCVVFSRTLAAAETPGLRIVADDPAEVVRQLKGQSGKDIWLYGGGELFGSLLGAGLVDTVELAVIPVLLGDGVPLLSPGHRTTLELHDSKVLAGSGIVILAYRVAGSEAAAPAIHWAHG